MGADLYSSCFPFEIKFPLFKVESDLKKCPKIVQKLSKKCLKNVSKKFRHFTLSGACDESDESLSSDESYLNFV